MFRNFFSRLRTFLAIKENNEAAETRVSEVWTEEVNLGGDAGSERIVVLKLRDNDVNPAVREPPPCKKTRLLKLVREKWEVLHAALSTLKEKRWCGTVNIWHGAAVSMGAGVILGYTWGCTLWY